MQMYPPEHFHTLLAFDLDNTLIPETEPLFIDPYFQCVYEFLSTELDGLSFEDFKLVAREAFVDIGCCIRSFAAKYGKDQTWVFTAYEHVAKFTLPAVEPHVNPDPILKAKIRLLEALGYKIIAFTQGHRNYALPLLKKIELDDILPESVVHDIIAINGALKREDIAYQFLRETYPGFNRYIMVEDSPLNLPAAFREEFETWFLGPKPIPPGVETSIMFRHAGIHATVDAMIIRALAEQ